MSAAMMPPQPLTAGMPDPATIAKQKDALAKAQDGSSWKDKISSLEAAHLQERTDSQQAFKGYRAQVETKERQLEDAHKIKVDAMRTEVMDIKKGFDNRCQEFKK